MLEYEAVTGAAKGYFDAALDTGFTQMMLTESPDDSPMYGPAYSGKNTMIQGQDWYCNQLMYDLPIGSFANQFDYLAEFKILDLVKFF